MTLACLDNVHKMMLIMEKKSFSLSKSARQRMTLNVVKLQNFSMVLQLFPRNSV